MRLVDNIFNSMVGKGETAPYIDCDYLESGSGTNAYIDTGVCIGGQGKVEIDDLVLLTIAGSESNWLAGTTDGGLTRAFNMRAQTGGFALRYNGDNFSSTSRYTSNTRYRYVRDKNVITIYDDNDNVFFTTTRPLSANIPSHNHYLFALDNAGRVAIINSLKRMGKVRLYDDNGVLVRNYSPKIRAADGVAGMYDAVNDTFELSPNGELFNYGYFT